MTDPFLRPVFIPYPTIAPLFGALSYGRVLRQLPVSLFVMPPSLSLRAFPLRSTALPGPEPVRSEQWCGSQLNLAEGAARRRSKSDSSHRPL